MPSEGKPAFRRHTVHDKAAHHDRTKKQSIPHRISLRLPIESDGRGASRVRAGGIGHRPPSRPDTQAHHITTRPSSKGNYTGATVQVKVENQEQLDNIYRALTSHELVKVVL